MQNSPLESSCVVVALIENYSTSKPLKVCHKKNHSFWVVTFFCRKWAIYWHGAVCAFVIITPWRCRLVFETCSRLIYFINSVSQSVYFEWHIYFKNERLTEFRNFRIHEFFLSNYETYCVHLIYKGKSFPLQDQSVPGS